MPVIVGGRISGDGRVILSTPGAPVAGTDAIQTLTFGGTPTGGTFKLTCEGRTTANITWSATNATLAANITAGLVALPTVGAAGVVTTVGTAVAGIGTMLVTFSGANVAKRVIAIMTVAANAMTGTDPTLVVTLSTPGVEATYRNAPTGALLVRTDTGVLHANTSTTAQAPTWTAQT